MEKSQQFVAIAKPPKLDAEYYGYWKVSIRKSSWNIRLHASRVCGEWAVLDEICFHQIDGSVGNLVTYVWRLWNNKSFLELVDPAMGESYDKDEVIRCIHISLLCVQENPVDRPTMSTLFQMLTNTFLTLPVPQSPGVFFRVRSEPNSLAERLDPGPSNTMSFAYSIDDASITSVNLR
ncbi:putative cysteine-rich receptor-like protein kinase 16 [Arabidopsis lyrata subsp. lyrata]|uniref:putative cysteine-rich receptor-like protein kinase 16 n=1 Tax=Arabidopsis lyrata subsp. lyrata TaxID=81972 RepID=UPI000A29CFFD|nr:putative cysteine-rich receptor-like protein kinase 16 [Arabidopsis lyrata subsp. lyrata]|eukprot:XP_020873769.1 putative cysteine-rich receptor-like protein kinase 16 [Arabidopsis lyrata subsp. lyrata]